MFNLAKLIYSTSTTIYGNLLDFCGVSKRCFVLSELGYEFRPMENDSDIHTQVVLFSALAFIYAAILATTFTSFVIGLREYLASYHPMDRTKNSNCCGRIFVISAMVLFASAPIILLISTFLLAYIQAHNGVCPFVQAQVFFANSHKYLIIP